MSAPTAEDAPEDTPTGAVAPADDPPVTTEPSSTEVEMTDRSFLRWVALITGVGLLVRVAYVLFVTHDSAIWGDAYFYHYSSNLIADGHGFINPIEFREYGLSVQAADHPPIYLLYLAAWSWLGITGSTGSHARDDAHRRGHDRRLGVCRQGDRREARRADRRGARVHLPERLGTRRHAALRDRRDPHRRGDHAAVVSLLAPPDPRAERRCSGSPWAWRRMSRSELLLLAVLVVLPLILIARTVPLRRRIGWLFASGAACVLTLAPWVGFNLSRFDHPVLLSAGYEITLSTATCDLTYYGEFTGYWNILCPVGVLEANGIDSRGMDQSELAKLFRDESLEYIGNHKSRLPYVVLARWGRITGLYKPLQQVRLDVFPEGRSLWVARGAMAGWYIVAPLAIAGALVLRRRRIPVFPSAGPTDRRLDRGDDHVRHHALPRVCRGRDLPSRGGRRRCARPRVHARPGRSRGRPDRARRPRTRPGLTRLPTA